MKRILWHTTAASLLTLAAYLLFSAFWGLLLSVVENALLKRILIGLMTTAAFGFFLVYMTKIRGDVGDREVMADYRDIPYTSLRADGRLVLRREKRQLLTIAVIVFLCFVLNTADSLIFGKKTISFPTFIFVTMCLGGAEIPIPFLDYAVSILLDGAAYLAILLLWRKRRYRCLLAHTPTEEHHAE